MKKKAVIEALNGVKCLVDDISDRGARIHLAAAAEVPTEFYLTIKGEERPRYCAVVRRKPLQLSVYFV